MSDEIPVRVAGGEFRFDREHYERGDELKVPERTLEAHPRTLERVDEAEGEPESADDADEDAEPLDPHPQDLNVDELEKRVEDVTDVDLLKRIRKAEKEGDDPRSTAVHAIDDRLDELEE